MAQFCVIGAGQWGKNHLRIMNELLGRDAAVCEVDKGRIEQIRNTYPGIKVFTNFADVLADKEIKAISVCTPASAHYEMVKAALKAGKDVFVEKPITLESAKAMELVRMAEGGGRILMVGHVFRHHPAVQELRRMIAAGELGKINLIMASRLGLMTPRPDCGVIFDFALHEFDTASYLLGEKPTDVTATGMNCPPEHKYEDAAFITLKYPSGAAVHIQVSWLTPLKIRDIMVVGSKKTARVDYLSHDIEVYDSGIVPEYDSFGKFNLIMKQGEMTVKTVSADEPLKNEIRHFISCVNTRSKPLTDGRGGAEAVYIAENALKAYEGKNTVKLKWAL